MRLRGDQGGFTLPELLALVVLSVGLFGVSFSLLHVRDYSAENRDNIRQLEIALLAQTIRRYTVATGSLPPKLPAKPALITSQKDGYNLCSVLVPTYLHDLPMDPIAGLKLKTGDTSPSTEPCNTQDLSYSTGYYISRDKVGRVVLSAAVAETRRATVTLSL